MLTDAPTDTPRTDAADVAARNKIREQLRLLEQQGEDYIWRTAKKAGDEWDHDRREIIQLTADITAARAKLEYTKGPEFNRRLALVAQNWRTRTNKVEAELAACRAALRNVLDTREVEAKAANTYKVAVENFTDSEPDYQAYSNALIAASDAEKAARAILSPANRPGEEESC